MRTLALNVRWSCRRVVTALIMLRCSIASPPIPSAIAVLPLSTKVSPTRFRRARPRRCARRALQFRETSRRRARYGRVQSRHRPHQGAGWHVVPHVDAPDVIPLGDDAKLPLPFIIDHMGRVPSAAGIDQPPLRALIELSRLENCWIKVCGSERISMPPYTAAVPIAHALVEAAPTRVLWGTDFPHPNATHEADEADLVDLVPQFAPDPLAQERLLVDNPARLYGFN